MREDFVEPLPPIQTNATLLFGQTRVACYIVDLTTDEFRVAVPGGEHYEGDPKVTLVTRDAIYPVRIVLQEAHAGGYSYRLLRMNETCASGNNFFQRFGFPLKASHCCAAGLVAAVIASFCCIPMTGDYSPLVALRGMRKEAFGWCSPSIAETDRVPPGISVDKSLVAKDSGKSTRRDTKKKESAGELQTVSVSIISPASMVKSKPGLLPEDDQIVQAGSAPPSVNAKMPSLTSLLNEGQVGRLQTANSTLVPWLFSSTQSDEFGILRISDAALFDLQQFERGLRGLTGESCDDAIKSLRQTLKLARNVNNARTVHGTQGVFVVKSEDANVYFRTFNGTVELVRVLPIDFSKAQ